MPQHTCRQPEYNLQQSVHLFNHVEFRDQTQVMKLGGKDFYLLNHLYNT